MPAGRRASSSRAPRRLRLASVSALQAAETVGGAAYYNGIAVSLQRREQGLGLRGLTCQVAPIASRFRSPAAERGGAKVEGHGRSA